MRNRKRITIIFVLTALVFLTLTGICTALGHFQEGIITRKVLGHSQPLIIIDNVKYMLMPEVKVSRVTNLAVGGGFTAVPENVKNLEAGIPVLFKALGHNIYEIQTIPQETGHE